MMHLALSLENHLFERQLWGERGERRADRMARDSRHTDLLTPTRFREKAVKHTRGKIGVPNIFVNPELRCKPTSVKKIFS